MMRTVYWVIPVLVTATCLLLERPPAPERADCPVERFSAERALEYVKGIARAPHPMGSQENDRVRAYVLDSLRDLGFDPYVPPSPRAPKNVIARRGGQDNTKAIILLAHYDSVGTGPGAADDASGVAAILEALRALNTGAPLRNDLIVLFTDGEEEPGLLGAKAFVEEQQVAMDEIGLVLNFEARGNAGQSFMFETSANNGNLIAAFAQAAPHPYATSFSQAIYKQMPNDTDLTIFNEAGLPGMNFAFVGGLPYYHSPRDTPENLSLRSLQQHGDYALALARHFGNRDLRSLDAPPSSYFSLLGRWLVHYPESWAPYLLALGVLLLLALSVRLYRGGQIRIRTVLGDAIIIGVAVALLAALVDAVWMRLFAVEEWDFYLIDHLAWILLPVALLTHLSIGALSKTFAARHGAASTVIGVLSVVAVLGVLALFLLPGAAYLFTWSLLGGVLSLALLTWNQEGGRISRAMALFAGLALFPTFLLFTPMLLNLWHLVPFRGIQPVLIVALMSSMVLPVAEIAIARNTAVPADESN